MNGSHTRPAALLDALGRSIVGQRSVLETLVLTVISGGHVLLEGAPGVAKTLACRALAAAIGGTFRRIQFTPDLLPSDIVGTRVFDQRTTTFATVPGPIFANVVLADEINRAPAKVQSALLEGMQEHHATIGPETLPFPDPFVVLATMNPLDGDGTYALPLAQMDRFLAKVVVGYPGRDDERAIVDRFGSRDVALPENVVTLEDVRSWRTAARAVFLDAKLRDYIVDIVRATREPALMGEFGKYIESGASPRAALALAQLVRARAFLEERDFATPDDVRDLAPSVLRHRIAYGYRVATDGVDIEAIVAAAIGAVHAP